MVKTAMRLLLFMFSGWAIQAIAATPHVSSGGAHSCAINRAGEISCWGYNSNGQLGTGGDSTSVPVRVSGMGSGSRAVAAGGIHSCAIDAAGGAWCWGMNRFGQVGFPAAGPVDIPTPVPVVGLAAGVRAIAPGALHTCALTEAGGVLCWGWAAEGQLGNGQRAGPNDNIINTLVPAPTPVTGLAAGVVAIAAGGHNSCAVTSAGSVLCWGLRADSAVPAQVPGLSSVKAIAVAGTHSCAVTTAGEVYCWGFNNSGQLGDGTFEPSFTRPVRVAGLTGIEAVAVAELFAMPHSCALSADGEVHCWGRNWYGQLGAGEFGDFATPLRVVEATGAASITAGGAFTCAGMRDGTARCWGYNEFNQEGSGGQLGDGTFTIRRRPVIVLREQGGGSLAGGDWYLDLDPSAPNAIPDDKVPRFLALGTQRVAGSRYDTEARIGFAPQDIGRAANTYVFASAPSTLVGEALDGEPLRLGKAIRRDGAKADVACVLAQLTSTGQLRAVSPSALQAYTSGVLSGQGQAVTLLNGVPSVNIAGATFYVGYGTSGDAMLSQGTNRSITAVASGTAECRPQPPETGWWWNPAEGGRGYSIEHRGNNIFFAAFHYDASGRSTWHVATGPTSVDGSLYVGDLLSASGGQTLGGAYPGFPRLSAAGPLTLAFNDASHGTMVWPGGTVAIQRFDIVPGGLAAAARANQPESGWWWNPDEAGRGFFIEWQNGSVDIAGYMYDDQGNPVWYLGLYPTPDLRAIDGSWWSYANGQTMGGAYKPATRVSDHVAPLTVRFTGADTAVMTLPNGRTTNLRRHRF